MIVMTVEIIFSSHYDYKYFKKRRCESSGGRL